MAYTEPLLFNTDNRHPTKAQKTHEDQQVEPTNTALRKHSTASATDWLLHTQEQQQHFFRQTDAQESAALDFLCSLIAHS